MRSLSLESAVALLTDVLSHVFYLLLFLLSLHYLPIF